MAAPPPRGLSLYDNLHDPNDPSPSATISSAPVTYQQGGSTAGDQAAKKLLNPALQFQPIRRPQVKQPKAKTTFPKAIPRPAPAAASAAATPAAATGAAQSIPHQSTLADWAVTEEDEWMYGIGEKRQRGGRKKKKKRQEQFETDWDEMYDPTRPTNVDEFLKSDEKVEEVREWKALLYRHRKKHEDSDMSDSEEEAAPPPSKLSSSSHGPPEGSKTNMCSRTIRSASFILVCATSTISSSRSSPGRNCRRCLCPSSSPLDRPTTSCSSSTSTTTSDLRIITTSPSTSALRTRHNIQSPHPLHPNLTTIRQPQQ